MTKLTKDPWIIENAEIIRSAIAAGVIQSYMVDQMMITAYHSYVEDTGKKPKTIGEPIQAIKLLLGM
jgi:hypothetical protein